MNFWNDLDPVTTHRGVSSAFPWMLDHRIRTRTWGGSHDAEHYLRQPAVATAVGYGLFGSKSKALVRVESGIEIALDYAETVALLALRYAHHLKEHLEGDRRERFQDALREVQASTVGLIKNRNDQMVPARPLPAPIARLAVDLTEVDSPTPEPAAITQLSKEDAIVPLISIAAANVIRPYEIVVSKERAKSQWSI